jgi:hypothetical protein
MLDMDLFIFCVFIYISKSIVLYTMVTSFDVRRVS